jgi:CRP-like cAMP-binding protein
MLDNPLVKRTALDNHLVAMPPRRVRARLLVIGETVELPAARLLCVPGLRLRHVYFPIEGFFSIQIPVKARPSLEVGLIGREGAFGAGAALAFAVSPVQAVVQAPSTAVRISAVAFRVELEASAVFRRIVNRYIFVLTAQFAQATVCAGFHSLGGRLARRLLMADDRAESSGFHLTHATLAQMLGVRRVGITNAAGLLQEQKLVSYARGEIDVLDRCGLEAASCECYRGSREMYDRLLGPVGSRAASSNEARD